MTIMGCVGTHVYNMSFLYVGKEIDAKINVDEIIDSFDRLGHRSTFKLAKNVSFFHICYSSISIVCL
jgi:hypothetical protein